MASAFFNKEQQAAIVSAIQEAEKNTSGEVRVHIEEKCASDAFTRAKEVFEKLGMHKTELHNGVLFYLAVKDHKFAILGDKGINDKVPAHFWDDIKEMMQTEFRGGRFTEGLSQGILRAGQQLKVHFPYQSNDSNELSDQISFGDSH